MASAADIIRLGFFARALFLLSESMGAAAQDGGNSSNRHADPAGARHALAPSENDVRLAQQMQVGPCVPEWGYSYNRLKLAQLLGQLGVFLTPVGRVNWEFY